jgi:hypothetical protein
LEDTVLVGLALRIVGFNLDPRVQIVQYRFTRIVKNRPSDQDLKIRIREREGLTGVDLMVIGKRLTAVAAAQSSTTEALW